MNVETLIKRVIQITDDSEIKAELARGVKIQFTVSKEGTKVKAFLPKDRVVSKKVTH